MVIIANIGSQVSRDTQRSARLVGFAQKGVNRRRTLPPVPWWPREMAICPCEMAMLGKLAWRTHVHVIVRLTWGHVARWPHGQGSREVAMSAPANLFGQSLRRASARSFSPFPGAAPFPSS